MASSPYVFDYHERFALDAPVEQVWAAIERLDLFPTWWTWLRDFHHEGGGLVDGAWLHGVVVPPVPYRLRLQVQLTRCTPPGAIDAAVEGDLRGAAHLTLAADGAGSTATLQWSVEMMQRPMRLACLVARPLLVWGHNRVVEMALVSFRQRLADGAVT